MELKALLKIDRYKVESGHYVIAASVPVGRGSRVEAREFHIVRRPSGKAWVTTEPSRGHQAVSTRTRLSDAQSDVYDLLDLLVEQAQRAYDGVRPVHRPVPLKTPGSLDRSTADSVLLDVLSDEAKRVTLDEWGSMISEFLKAWYSSPGTDMHRFGREWATARVQDVHRSLDDGTAGLAPTFGGTEGD